MTSSSSAIGGRGRVGRFAPSPTGPLHAGSLVAAMASWLDIRAHGGRWLVRIEDVDRPREQEGAADAILATLAAFGFRWDGAVLRQGSRDAFYRQAFERLRAIDVVYPCGCTRREIEQALVGDAVEGTAIYPGTCRHGLADGRTARAWRMRTNDEELVIEDRAAGTFRQNVAHAVGDFVVRRADGLWAYQLAVVVDDAAQGVTDIVRGADLLDSTPRQRVLQSALGLPIPRTLHVPVVVDREGRKLSKSADTRSLDATHPLPDLEAAVRHLGLTIEPADDVARFWERATAAWAARWPV